MKWFKKKKDVHSPRGVAPLVIQQKAKEPVNNQYLQLSKKDEKLTLNYYHSNSLRIMIAKANKEFGEMEEEIYLNDQKSQVRRILG